MEFDPQKAKTWLDGAAIALPKLAEILDLTTSEVMIIGAGVFDIYHEQGWIPAFKRKTGDLDISVGLISGGEDYKVLQTALVNRGYTVDTRCSYRFYSPTKIPGALTYIDLLAHPARDGISYEYTKSLMGVGDNFSFGAISFARLSPLSISDKIFCPNPLAMVALKRAGYLDDPLGRIKDLADIAELAWGIVEKGMHFEMHPLWESIKHHPDAAQIRNTLKEFGSGESVTWDLDNARQELLKRMFDTAEIEQTIPERLTEWSKHLS